MNKSEVLIEEVLKRYSMPAANINKVQCKRREKYLKRYEIDMLRYSLDSAYKTYRNDIQYLEKAGYTIRTGDDLIVLDYGCGTGKRAIGWACMDSVSAVGMDMSEEYVQIAMSKVPAASKKKIMFVTGDGTNSPFREKSFDMIISHSVLEHIPDNGSFISEAYRILKPGGILFLSWIPSKTWFMDAHVPIGFWRYLFKKRSQAIEDYLGINTQGTVNPPDYFHLHNLFRRFEWDRLDINPGSIHLEYLVYNHQKSMMYIILKYASLVLDRLLLKPTGIAHFISSGWKVIGQKHSDGNLSQVN